MRSTSRCGVRTTRITTTTASLQLRGDVSRDGAGEIGHLPSCARDSYFIQGYAPNIALTRTSTIMQGGKRCDFRYARQAAPENGDA